MLELKAYTDFDEKELSKVNIQRSEMQVVGNISMV